MDGVRGALKVWTLRGVLHHNSTILTSIGGYRKHKHAYQAIISLIGAEYVVLNNYLRSFDHVDLPQNTRCGKIDSAKDDRTCSVRYRRPLFWLAVGTGQRLGTQACSSQYLKSSWDAKRFMF